MHSKNYRIYSKKSFLIVLGLLSLAVFIFIYYLVFAPIITRLFISKENCIYHGLEYYDDESYLCFDNGTDYKNILNDIDVLKKGEIIDFYYVDNYIEDNPIYGKMCDIYSLDVRLSANDYEQEKIRIKEIAANYEPNGDYVLYALPYKNENPYVIVIAFCDEISIMRCIMITELDTTLGFAQVFRQHANLDWGT